MQSEAQLAANSKSSNSRKSLLVELLKGQNSSQVKKSPRKDNQVENSPKRKNQARTPTSAEKEQDKNLYKTAYNAIGSQNFEAIDQVITQLEISERDINSPLKIKSLDGKALIHLAAETMDPDNVIMKYIIEQKGANIQLTDSLGQNALHLACRAGKLETVKYLESKGLDLLSTNRLGDYSFSFAAFSGNLDLIKYLHSKQIPIDLRNHDNISPLDIAYEKKHQEIIDFLLEAHETQNQ